MAKKGYARTFQIPEGEKGEGTFVTLLLGNIGKDWGVRQTGSGKTVAQASLAVNVYRDGANVTDWYTVIAWERDAEILAQYAGKGKQVLLETVGKQRTFTSKGEEKTVDEFTVRSFILLGGDEQAPRQPATFRVPAAAAASPDDDELF